LRTRDSQEEAKPVAYGDRLTLPVGIITSQRSL